MKNISKDYILAKLMFTNDDILNLRTNPKIVFFMIAFYNSGTCIGIIMS